MRFIWLFSLPWQMSVTPARSWSKVTPSWRGLTTTTSIASLAPTATWDLETTSTPSTQKTTASSTKMFEISLDIRLLKILFQFTGPIEALFWVWDGDYRWRASDPWCLLPSWLLQMLQMLYRPRRHIFHHPARPHVQVCEWNRDKERTA